MTMLNSTLFSRGLVALACVSLLSSCSFFEGDGDDESSESSDSNDASDSETADGETGGPPEVGLRVFPQYMLQSVQAIVTINVDMMQVQCPPDDDDGGYLCDISSVDENTVLVRVELDGFETALQEPTIEQDVIQSIDVHLVPLGGALGIWSACTLVDLYESCTELCAAQGDDCSPVACDSSGGASQVVTMESFATQDCSGDPLESQAQSCSLSLPLNGGSDEAIRCCCSG